MSQQQQTQAHSSVASRIFLLKFCEHENAQAHIFRLVGDNLTAFEKDITQGSARPAFRKEDIFAPLPDGSMIFESSSFWQSFERIAERLAQNNESFGIQDFLRPTDRGKTLLQSATLHGRLDKVFAPRVWGGRHNEAYELWFSLDGRTRTHINILPVRRAIAATRGEKLREDRLAECGVTLEAIHAAVFGGTLEAVNNRLLVFGECVRKSDIFAPRATDGDTVFYLNDTWKNFEQIVAVLQKNGETLDSGDFLLKRLNHQSPLQRAIATGFLEKVFLPQIWAGRLDEMDRLWQQFVPADVKNSGEYEKWRREVLEAHYAKMFKPSPDLCAADFLRPCDNRPDSLTPLMLKGVWQDLGAIRRGLAEKNEQITMAHLRAATPDGKSSYLYIGVKNGALSQVLDIARQSGQTLTAADFMTPVRGGSATAFSEICAQGKLPELIKAELWAERPQDLAALWQAIPAGNPFKISLQSELSRVNVLAMRQKMLFKGRAATGATDPL